MVGLTRGTSKAHIARAALESIAFQTMDVLKSMEADAGSAIRELRVDGGATTNNLLMQIQADILGVKVVRPEITETTAMGAAYFAGLATGFWKNIDEIKEQWSLEKEYVPSSNNKEIVSEWNRAVETVKFWAEYPNNANS
jgi:glycerol kinase